MDAWIPAFNSGGIRSISDIRNQSKDYGIISVHKPGSESHITSLLPKFLTAKATYGASAIHVKEEAERNFLD